MVVPMLIYAAFSRGNAEAMAGVAIPAATDIAFALAILALLGDRVPSGSSSCSPRSRCSTTSGLS